MVRTLKYLLLSIKKNIFEFGQLSSANYLQELDRIGRQLERFLPAHRADKPLRILFGPSFCIYPPCFIHDRLISYALRLHGAEIIPIYCDGIQSVECNVYGGVWISSNFEKSCKYCIRQSKKIWQDNPILAIGISKSLEGGENKDIARKVADIADEEWADYYEDDLRFGLWVKDILINNYGVGDYHSIPDYNFLGLAHLKNLLLLKVAYERIIDNEKPDRVISNDSCYGMWALLQKLCERKGIPFYSYWTGGRRGTFCYAYNDGSMNLDFSRPWKKFSLIPLQERQKSKIQEWLNRRPSGKEVILDSSSLKNYCTDPFDLSKISLNKPTALLASNVLWDLAALSKEVIFVDIIDWIIKTIYWFTEHPQFQLIIKPHPTEADPSFSIAKERIQIVLSERKVRLPNNVFLLSPKVNLTVYQLFPLVRVGLVYTTTVGIEMAASGLPVITAGKSCYRGFGFTIDPLSKTEYFEVLEKVLLGGNPLKLDMQLDLAYKFILFYHYHYFIKLGLVDYIWNEVPKLYVKSTVDLLPRKNRFLDYVTDSIIMGLPIVSEDRWPPES